MEKDKQIDILAIGDIATDVFIKIKDAEAKCDPDGEHCKLCLSYGGKIPYEKSEICHAVGNSANVSVCVSRLGLSSALMTNLGDDQNGDECIEALKKEKVSTDFIKKESNKPTNYHYVLWYENEHTILTKHEKYEYEWMLKDTDNSPSWIYLSSLSEDSLDFHSVITEYLKANTNVKFAFQPGTFQIKIGYESLREIYKRTDVFFCNHEEAEQILKNGSSDIPTLLKEINNLGPKLVVITDGVNGSYAYDGNNVFFMKSVSGEALESTGAGDAFSGSFISAIFLGKDIETALIWASVNATSVILDIGPQKGLLTRSMLENKVLDIEDECKPIKLS